MRQAGQARNFAFEILIGQIDAERGGIVAEQTGDVGKIADGGALDGELRSRLPALCIDDTSAPDRVGVVARTMR